MFLVLVFPGAVLAVMGFMIFVKGELRISRSNGLEGAAARIAGAAVCALGLLIIYLAWTNDLFSFLFSTSRN
jgi:hypothetical protein